MTTAERLVKLLEQGGLSSEQRAEIGLQLAQLGDPRPGVGLLSNGLPDIDWVQIPAGRFTMGSHMGDLTADMSEMPQSVLRLPDYYISRYPITYAQYEVFVMDGGYHNNAFWTRAGRRWRSSREYPQQFWGDPNWHISNHPVVGVTWHEALAFCLWFGGLIGARAWLPGEGQWEKAARGGDNRRFPWGNQFSAEYANCTVTLQTDIYTRQTETFSLGRTTAVGLYPEGMSPYGVMDMAGNVSEWCASAWRPNYQTPEDNMPEGSAPRVRRGGSWQDRESSLRTTARKSSPPETSANTLGFRICAVA